MKLITIVFNIALIVFTSFILITEGISKDAFYVVLTLLLLIMPIFNLSIILGSRPDIDWLDFHLKRKASEEQIKKDNVTSNKSVLKITAILCNIILLGFSIWAFANQYPHQKESGIILYVLIVLLTPILSSVWFVFYKHW